MMRKLLVSFGALALTAGCTSGPVDPVTICKAALQGYNDMEMRQEIQCRRDVARSGFTAGHTAAQKYRDMPR